MKKDLMGYCGIYCGACDHYLATNTAKHLAENNDKLKKSSCIGCQGAIEDKICKWCRECHIKACARDKGVSICSNCEDFPCDKVKSFEKGLAHHKEAYTELSNSKELSKEEWLKKQEQRWICPNCGNKYSYYEIKCHYCGESLNGFFPDERTK